MNVTGDNNIKWIKSDLEKRESLFSLSYIFECRYKLSGRTKGTNGREKIKKEGVIGYPQSILYTCMRLALYNLM